MTANEATVAEEFIRIGILGATLMGREELRRSLEAHAIEVVVEESLSRFLSDVEHQAELDVLLLDLEQADDDELDILDALMEHSPVPMVFYDGGGNTDCARWSSRLATKIVEAALANDAPAAHAKPPLPPPARADSLLEGQHVWVLGASFGGPEALKRFLGALPAPPPATLIIGQHIGDGFVEVLAAQLSRVAPCRVVPAVNGGRLEPGVVYVAPVGHAVAIDPGGYLHFRPEAAKLGYRPSIDGLMRAVAERYGANSGGIIFSGMGGDGAEGCRAIAAAGGRLWAQDSGSCVIDSMPNSARATGVVDRSGPPEELAPALLNYLNELSLRASAG